MHHNAIDGSADGPWERPSKGIGAILERWNSTIVANISLSDGIQLEGRYTWFDMMGQLGERVGYKPVGPPHEPYLILSLEKYSHSAERGFNMQRQLRCVCGQS